MTDPTPAPTSDAGDRRSGAGARRRDTKGHKAIERTAARLERLKIEYVPVDAIHPNPYNPNRQSDHEFELLLRSIEEDGFTQPIICLQASREIVDGEHRWRAAHTLGMSEVPVVFTDYTPEQQRIATLRHNRARGSEDVELSAQVLRDLRELGALDWAQDSLMLDDVELATLMDNLAAPDALAGDDFSQAWEPGESSEERAANSTTAHSMTIETLERVREQERRLAEAQTQQERDAVRRDLDVFRFSLTFSGDEAGIVRRVLGDAPAQRILAFCRAAEAAE